MKSGATAEDLETQHENLKSNIARFSATEAKLQKERMSLDTKVRFVSQGHKYYTFMNFWRVQMLAFQGLHTHFDPVQFSACSVVLLLSVLLLCSCLYTPSL